MLRSISVLALLGLLTDVHPLQAASWENLPPLPSARFGAAAASSGDRLFVLGGFSDLGALTNATIWNQGNQTWSEAAPMSQARLFFAAASTSTAVFAIGGFVDGMPTANGERLDPATGTWSAIAPMPVARASFGAASIGGALFVAGGQGDDSSNLPQCFRFDPTPGAWTEIAPLPTPRSGVAAAAFDGKLWVIGGMDGQALDNVDRFDPASGLWTATASLPEPLWFASAASFDGRLWVSGGMDASYMRSSRVYSAGSDGVWRSEASLPASLATSAMGSMANGLAVIGGMDEMGMASALAFAQFAESAPPPPPPVDPLQVAVSLSPSALNMGSHGNWIKADIKPSGWSARDILVSSLYLGGVAVDPLASSSADDATLTVKFPRAAFTGLAAGTHLLVLVGNRADGTPIRGEVELTVSGSVLAVKKPGRALRPMASREGRGVVIHMERTEDVRLDVMDLQGRVVERVWHGTLAAGDHAREWPRAGASVSRGAYFMRLQRPSGTEVTKLLVVR